MLHDPLNRLLGRDGCDGIVDDRRALSEFRTEDSKLFFRQPGMQVVTAVHSDKGTLLAEAHRQEPVRPFTRVMEDVDADSTSGCAIQCRRDDIPRRCEILRNNGADMRQLITSASEAISADPVVVFCDEGKSLIPSEY